MGPPPPAKSDPRGRTPKRYRLAGWTFSAAVHSAVLYGLLSMHWAAPEPPPPALMPEPVAVSLVKPPPPEPPPPEPQDEIGGGAPETPAEPVPEPPKAPAPKPPSPRKAKPLPIPPDIKPLPAAVVPSPEPQLEVSAAELALAATADSGGGDGGSGSGSGSGAGSGPGGGSGGACNMTRRLQNALRRNAAVQSAIAEAGATRPVLVWNGEWVQSSGQEGKGLARLRQAILVEVGFAPEACRKMRMRGLVLIQLTDRPGGPRLVLGTGQWRWSDMLFAKGVVRPSTMP